MANDLHDSQLIEITPQGVRHPRSNWSLQWWGFKRQLHQSAYLVRWKLMEKTFGRTLGPIWVVLDPILQSAVYFFILSFVFNIKGTDVSFLSILMMITIWKLHGNLIASAPTLLISQTAVLQQTNFPVSVILMEFVGNELALFAMNFLIIVFVLLLAGLYPGLAWLYLPFVLIVQVTFTLVCVLLITAIGTFLRDFGSIVSVVAQMWFYASPVVYSMDRLGTGFYRTILEYTNPFCHILPAYRAVIFEGQVTQFPQLLLIFALSAVGLFIAFRIMDGMRIRVYQYL